MREASKSLKQAIYLAQRLNTGYAGISDVRYVDQKFFNEITNAFNPHVYAFELRCAQAVEIIAQEIINGAIIKFNTAKGIDYNANNLYLRHYLKIKGAIINALKLQWHNFDLRQFPQTLQEELTALIANDIKNIGWGKFTGSIWRQEGWKGIFVNLIDGNSQQQGLLKKLNNNIEIFVPIVPPPVVIELPFGLNPGSQVVPTVLNLGTEVVPLAEVVKPVNLKNAASPTVKFVM